MNTTSIHVVPYNDVWAVKREGEPGVLSVHSTKREAAEAAHRQGDGADVIIHGGGSAMTTDEQGGAAAVRGPDYLRVGRPRVRLSWGAIIAGLALTIALTWFLYLFGASIGVTVLDTTDTTVPGTAFGTTAILWMVFSSLLAFFVGALLVGYMTGERDEFVGIVHGVTLWAVSSTLMMVLGYLGFAALAGVVYDGLKTAATTTASAVTPVATGAASAAGSVGRAMQNTTDAFADSAFVDELQASLKDQAASMAARTSDGAVTPAEAEAAINRLDSQTLQRIAANLAAGQTQEARQLLRERTNLSEAETEAIVSGVEQELRERLNLARGQSINAELADALKSSLANQLARLDARGGTDVSQQDIRAALDDLDAATLRRVATRLISQDPEGATQILVANTRLTRAEVDELIRGVNESAAATYEEYKTTVNRYAEAATDYTETTLWTAVVMAAAGLAASAFGGWMGAQCIPYYRRD